MSFVEDIYAALMCADVDAKLAQVATLSEVASDADCLILSSSQTAVVAVPIPGRPQVPQLVLPRQLKSRKLSQPEGLARLLHAIAHIEFNAINLALDAAYRFRNMPVRYYQDWIKIASEEALHFKLVRGRLQELGYGYGDFDAHNGLWEMAYDTDHDVMVRMALVPRVLEARGLDVTPAIIERLSSIGDQRSIEVLEVILRDEVGHVGIGSHWYKSVCEARGLDNKKTFISLFKKHFNGQYKGPMNKQARLAAGFSTAEMALMLTEVC